MTLASPSALTDLLHAVRARFRLVYVDETQSVLLLYVERLLRATGREALRLRHLASGIECVVATGGGAARIVVLEYAGSGSATCLVDIADELLAEERWLLGWDQIPPPESPRRGADPEATQQLLVPPSGEDLESDPPLYLRRTLREAVYDEGRSAVSRALRRLCNEWEAAPESGCYVDIQLRTGMEEPRPAPAQEALRAWLSAPAEGRPARERPLFLLVGAPGAGKSTLLQRLAATLSREHLVELSRGAPVPHCRAPLLITVPPGDLAEVDLDRLVEGAVPGMSGRLARLWIELGLCVLILDGGLSTEDAARLAQLPTLLKDTPPRALIAERARYFPSGPGPTSVPLLHRAVAEAAGEAGRGAWELGYLEPLSDDLLQQYLLLRLPDPLLRSAAMSQLARSDSLRRLCRRPGLLAALTDASAGPPLLGTGVVHGAQAPPLLSLHRALRPAWLEGVAGDRRIERTARELLARVLARHLLESGGTWVAFWDLLPEVGVEVRGEADGARLLIHILRALDDTMFVVEHGASTRDIGPRVRFALPSAADYFKGEDLARRIHEADIYRVTACLQRGHNGQLRAAAVARSGRLCATGADDGTIRLWEAESGFLLRVFAGHHDPITALLFAEDDSCLVSASEDFTLRIWDVQGERSTRILTGHTGAVRALGYAPASALLCSGDADGTVRIWQLPSGRCVQTLQPPGAGVTCAAMTPDGLLCAVATTDSLVHIFHAWSGELLAVLGGHSGPVRSLALSHDGRLCASGSEDRTIRLTEVHTGNLVQALLGHEQAVTALAFSSDGRLLASGSVDQSARVFVLPPAGEHSPAHLLHCLRSHSGTVHCVAFQQGGPVPRGSNKMEKKNTRHSEDPPAGQLLLTAGGDGTALLWDGVTGELLRPLDGSAAGAPDEAALQVRSLAASPDGALLSVGGADGILRLWDLRKGRLLRELRGHDGALLCLAFSPDGRILASGGEDQAVCLWDPQLGELLDRLEGHTAEVTSLAFSPDGYLLASGSADHSVRLRESTGGLTLRTLTATAPVTQVLFTADGRRLAVAYEDGAIRQWETAGGPPSRVLHKHLSRITALAASADGRLLASAGDDQLVRVWDAQTGRAMHALWGHKDGVSALAFSPDGEILASAGWDRSLRIWEPRTGRSLGALPGWAGWVRGLCFSPDGRAVIAGGQDGVVIWQLGEGRVLAQLLALGPGWLALVPVRDHAQPESAPSGHQPLPPRYALYAAEPEAPPCLRMSDGLISYPISGWIRLCHRPHLVESALGHGPRLDLQELRDALLTAPEPMPDLESSGQKQRAAGELQTLSIDVRGADLDAYARRLTAEDLLRGDADARGELDRGVVVPLGAVAYAPGRIAGRLQSILGMFVLTQHLGDVPSAETGYLLQRNPDVLRTTDVSFVSRERIPQAGTAGFFTGAPDLAAEVVSAVNPWEAVEKKALEYLQTGAQLVWILDPQTRTVHVHESPVQVRILGEEDELSGGAVLPGFAVPVRDLFS